MIVCNVEESFYFHFEHEKDISQTPATVSVDFIDDSVKAGKIQGR